MQNTGVTFSTAITQGDTEMLRLVNIYKVWGDTNAFLLISRCFTPQIFSFPEVDVPIASVNVLHHEVVERSAVLYQGWLAERTLKMISQDLSSDGATPSFYYCNISHWASALIVTMTTDLQHWPDVGQTQRSHRSDLRENVIIILHLTNELNDDKSDCMVSKWPNTWRFNWKKINSLRPG